MSASRLRDDGTVTLIASNSGVPTEVDSTNAKGLYLIALSQSETNANKLLFSGKSSTANVILIPTIIYTDPANYTTLGIDNSGNIVGIAGTITTLDALSTHGDSTWTTSSLTASGIWSNVTRTLTAATNITSDNNAINQVLLAHLDADISSMMARYTQPTGFLSATFPSGTIANTTNITAGTIANLTNAPTSGDFTSTMKTSLAASAVASVTGSVGSISGIAFPGNFDVLSIDSNGKVKIQSGITKNTALSNFEFPMYDAVDHVTPKTGLTITATKSIDGGSFISCSNNPIEIGSTGNYKINLTTADLNGNIITFKFIATGADPMIIEIITTP